MELEELRLRVRAAHPTAESDVEALFNTNDVSNDGLLPYDIVDALLRHYLLLQGFQDHIFQFLDTNGKLDLGYVRKMMHESNMLVVNEETMLSCEEMKLLAVIWLKLLSDSYLAKTLNQPNPNQLQVLNPNDSVTSNQLIHLTTHTNTNTMENVSNEENMDNSMGNEENNVEEGLERYMSNIRDEIEKNRMCGIKCYAYPASLTPNGSCASAGAVVPHRRLKTHKQHKNLFTLFGCC
ncbi:hypothetical protein TpMuguga_02g00561 [Theileria parva strain Muguga]|uniref:EF-hand domain-containing protein n=1 Tax=Theileria parva TaxID=5875 RepID=Q4N4S9_THEPA|nr:uncharacterized protein TpMuguga_02g00561 [Theileria parva strain Muguga]EAN32844.1 hypothetical protein TpMuguga_02g00561 [Theileria parva strain Muguga]|eukprot:XP_765127.1 hypothetical protein [Theileria parva strain Muguga]